MEVVPKVRNLKFESVVMPLSVVIVRENVQIA
jgi:hypothetical protein